MISGSADRTVKLWEVETGQLIQTYCEHSGFVISVAINSNGNLFISGGNDNLIAVRKINGSAVQKKILDKHKNEVSSLALFKDESKFISGSHDSTIKIWSCENLELLKSIDVKNYKISHLSFNPSGEFFVAAEKSGNLIIVDSKTEKVVHSLKAYES